MRLALLALAFGKRAVCLGFLFQSLALERIVAEDGDGACHLADLVPAPFAIDRRLEIAGGELPHGFAQFRQRPEKT
ncbi:hypothetical protein D3C72_1748860 [compost metagenome]